MKKRMLILLLLTVTMSGCRKTKSEAQFVLISKEDFGDVVYDKRTGVEYWRSMSGYNSGNLTLLVDRDGNPLIYAGE